MKKTKSVWIVKYDRQGSDNYYYVYEDERLARKHAAKEAIVTMAGWQNIDTDALADMKQLYAKKEYKMVLEVYDAQGDDHAFISVFREKVRTA